MNFINIKTNEIISIDINETPKTYAKILAKSQDQLDEQGNIIEKATWKEITEEEYLALQPKRVKPTAEEIATEQRKAEIKARLVKLTEDFMQSALGYVVTDLNSRKTEFNNLYTELCRLEGKEPRKLNYEQINLYIK